jgi:hypothetical protein
VPESELFKVQFYEEDVGYENLWASRVKGSNYRLESIPFFVYGVAQHDVVAAKPDPEGRLVFLSVVESSGNRTLRARCDDLDKDLNRKNGIIAALATMNCGVEELRSLLAINAPPEVDLAPVTAYLLREGLSWEYGHPKQLNK